MLVQARKLPLAPAPPESYASSVLCLPHRNYRKQQNLPCRTAYFVSSVLRALLSTVRYMNTCPVCHQKTWIQNVLCGCADVLNQETLLNFWLLSFTHRYPCMQHMWEWVGVSGNARVWAPQARLWTRAQTRVSVHIGGNERAHAHIRTDIDGRMTKAKFYIEWLLLQCFPLYSSDRVEFLSFSQRNLLWNEPIALPRKLNRIMKQMIDSFWVMQLYGSVNHI